MMTHLKLIKYIRIKFKEKNWKVELKKKEKKVWKKIKTLYCIYKQYDIVTLIFFL